MHAWSLHERNFINHCSLLLGNQISGYGTVKMILQFIFALDSVWSALGFCCNFKPNYRQIFKCIFMEEMFNFLFSPNTVTWCSCFPCTQPGPHVHVKFYTSVWHLSWYSVVCTALWTRGSPCVLTVQTHTGLPQSFSRHNDLDSYSITAPTATTNVNLLCGIHRTQWGNKYRNTTSTQYFLIPSPSSPLSPPPDMGVILFLVVDSSHHFSFRDRNTPRPHEQTPRISTTDWC